MTDPNCEDMIIEYAGRRYLIGAIEQPSSLLWRGFVTDITDPNDRRMVQVPRFPETPTPMPMMTTVFEWLNHRLRSGHTVHYFMRSFPRVTFTENAS